MAPMGGYGAREVAKMLGLSLGQVRAFVRAGFLDPERGPRRELRFSFQDLVLLRSAQGLVSARIAPRRVRRALQPRRRVARSAGAGRGHPRLSNGAGCRSAVRRRALQPGASLRAARRSGGGAASPADVPQAGAGVIHVGTSGYNYEAWRGSFYPEDLSSKKMLGYYAERFSTVEINYSFYRKPTPKILQGWSAQVPPRFRFALKAWQRITHQKRLRDSEEFVDAFAE